jgi:proteasome lid subunit RPN8/RPN11
MITYISQNAFWGLLISAVEVYKRECFGLLIGHRDRRVVGPDAGLLPSSAAHGHDPRRRVRGSRATGLRPVGAPGHAPGSEMYIVEHALPFQSAGRRHRGVVSNPRAHLRIERFLRNIPQTSVIGDFHSHTMWGYSRAANHPSDTDLEGMTAGNVYVIVSINDRLREVSWSYNDDGSLSGTTDDHYFRLTSYTMTPGGEPRRSPILCPYAIGFDARHVMRRALAF